LFRIILTIPVDGERISIVILHITTTDSIAGKNETLCTSFCSLVLRTSPSSIANIIGNGNVTCTGVYYLSETETDSISGTTALNSTQVGNEASFVGFDFVNIWVMGANGPELK